MSFKAPVFTNKGKQLYASCLAGKNEIIFTNIKLGDGELMAQAIADLDDLVNPIKTIVLNDKKLIGNDQVLIRAVFKNIDIDTGFYWREVGLYAQDPENPEDRSKDILFCYQNAGDTAEYIPSASSGLIDKILSMSLVVSDVNSVNVSFFSESYALKEDLDEQIAIQAQSLANHKTDANAHSELFSQYVKKSGDTMSGALVMSDSAQIFKNKDDQFLGLYGGSDFNSGAFFEVCGKDHAEQNGNFNIYANNGTQSARLNGTPNGSLTWGGKNLVRSVNGVNADESGNVNSVAPIFADWSAGVDITSSVKNMDSTTGYTFPYNCVMKIGFQSTGFSCLAFAFKPNLKTTDSSSDVMIESDFFHLHTNNDAKASILFFKKGQKIYKLSNSAVATGVSNFTVYPLIS